MILLNSIRQALGRANDRLFEILRLLYSQALNY